MAVDQVLLAELRELRERQPESDGGEMRALTSPAMVLAYVIAVSREEGLAAAATADRIETLLFDLRLPREMLREAAATLKALRYPVEVTAMLAHLARKAKPTPPRWWSLRRSLKPVVRRL